FFAGSLAEGRKRSRLATAARRVHAEGVRWRVAASRPCCAFRGRGDKLCAGGLAMNIHSASRYQDVYARSMQDPEGFWADAARAIDWIEPAKKVFDPTQGLYGRWFAGAVVNTCYNALDRHVAGGRADQLALIHDSPLTNSVSRFTYAEMLHEVRTFAAILQDFGVAKGDRVVI